MYQTKLTTLLLAGAVSANLAAQANVNVVERNNKTSLIGATTVHTPIEYFGAGIIAGTHSYRWIPSLVNDRSVVGLISETRRFSGFTIMLEPTQYQGPIQGGYAPKMEIRRAVFTGRGAVPNYSRNPLITVAQRSIVFRSSARRLLTCTLCTAIAFSEREVVITAEWKGGERLGQRGQVITGSHYEKTFLHPSPLRPSATIGSRLPNRPVRQNSATNELSRPYMSYSSDRPVVNVRASWAHLLGNLDYGVATGTSQLNSSAGSFQYEVAAGVSNRKLLAVSMFNFGAVNGVPSRLLGQIVEVNIFDQFIGVLGSVSLDASGNGRLARIDLQALPGTLGLALGIEFMIIDVTNLVATGSTQPRWVRVGKTLELDIFAPDDSKLDLVSLVGRIVQVRARTGTVGFGVRFEKPNPEAQTGLDGLVDWVAER